MRAGEREELQDGAAAFKVHHVGAASLHDARADAFAVEQVDQASGQVLALHGDLEVEVAARVGHEAAAEERAAQVGRRAALLLHEVGLEAKLQASIGRENPHVDESRREAGLRRSLNEVVRGLVQHAAAHREVRLEMVQLVQQLDDEARHGRHVGCYLDAVLSLAAEEQRSFDAHERGQRRLLAVRARGRDASQLVLYLRRERHSFNTPANASRKAAGSCQVG